MDKTEQANGTLDELYATELQPVLAELEAERRRVQAWSLVSAAVIAVVVVLLAGVVLLNNAEIGIFAVFILGFVGWGLWWLINHKRIQNYRSGFKQRVIGRLVSFLDPGLTYYPDDCITEQEFRASQIFRHRIDRYNGEDLIVGQLGATAFRFSEVHAEYKTSTIDAKGRRKTHWNTLFRGVFFVADFNKDFQGLTLVLPDATERWLGRLGQQLQDWGGLFQPGDLVRLEDPEFERMFVVYAQDQIEARYILSPSLMQRLVAFRQRMNEDISLAFVNSNVYIAILMGKNRFEPPFWGSANLALDDIRAHLEDIRLAEGVVAELNLNTRIWSKR